MTHPKRSILARLLTWFLLWTALRSMHAVYLGLTSTEYRHVTEAAFGPAVWVGEGLYAFLAAGAVVAIWMRARGAVTLVLAALAISTSLLLFQFLRAEADPERARTAFAESRRLRGVPLPPEQLDQMFSPSGRRVTWVIDAIFALGPLALLLARRHEFEPAASADDTDGSEA